MGRPGYDTIEDWAAGVITATEVDALPPNASPRGRNSSLLPIAGTRASVRKRKGLNCVNTTAVTGSPAIIGQLEFYLSGTLYHLLVSNTGRLDRRSNVDGSVAAADALTPTPFTTGNLYPSSTVARNLAFFCNGTDKKKFVGASGVQAWGITAPSGAPTLTASATAGLHNGTYEGFITYYNSNTDNESSPGPTSATASPASKKIDWSWSASADAQVTHVRLYLRNTATQPFFYRVTEIAVGTTTYASSVADSSLITKAPISNENDPPPASITHCVWHNDRMFVTDGTYLYYGKYGKPEAFSTGVNIIRLETDNGEDITGLFSFGPFLVVTKRTQLWVLVMPDPQDDTTWSPQLVDESIGCTSHRSWVVSDGVARWWSVKGMVEWTGNDSPRVTAQLLLAPTVGPESLNFANLHLVVAADDVVRDRVIFAVPEAGKSRNTLYLPFNYRLRCFESDGWTAIDAASLCTIEDSDGVPWVYVGGYKGQLFRWWDETCDGVAEDTTRTGTVTSATSSTLTASAATFDTTGAGLTERYVVAVDPAGTRTQRRRIASNTSTVLTLDSGETWTDTPANGWTFIVGGIDFAWDVKALTGDLPFIRKRYLFLYLLVASENSEVDVDLSLFFNYSSVASFTSTLSLVAEAEVGEWDSGEWDTAQFGGMAAATHKKVRIAKKARSWRLRIENRQPDEDLVLHKVGMRYELLTDRHTAG